MVFEFSVVRSTLDDLVSQYMKYTATKYSMFVKEYRGLEFEEKEAEYKQIKE